MRKLDAFTRAFEIAQEISKDPSYQLVTDPHRHFEGARLGANPIHLTPSDITQYIFALNTVKRKERIVASQVEGGTKEVIEEIIFSDLYLMLKELYAEGIRYGNILYCPGAYCIGEGDLGAYKILKRLEDTTTPLKEEKRALYSHWYSHLMTVIRSGYGEDAYGMSFVEVVECFARSLEKALKHFPELHIKLTLSLRKEKDRNIILQHPLVLEHTMKGYSVDPITPGKLVELYNKGYFSDVDFSDDETAIPYSHPKVTAFIHELTGKVPMQFHMGEPGYRLRKAPYENISWLLEQRRMNGLQTEGIAHAIRFFDEYVLKRFAAHRIFGRRWTNPDPALMKISPESNVLTGGVPSASSHMILDKLLNNSRKNESIIGNPANYYFLIATDNPITSQGENPLQYVYARTVAMVVLLANKGKSLVTPEQFVDILMKNQQRYKNSYVDSVGTIFHGPDESVLDTKEIQRVQIPALMR